MRVKLNKVRLSFPKLFKAEEFEPGDGKARYDATFLIEKGSENDKTVKAAILAAAEEKHGKKAPAFLKSVEGNSGKYCYLDGDLVEYDGYAGHMSLGSHRKQADGPPTIKSRDGKQDLKEADGKPYAGCYVNAIVDIYIQDGKYPGVRAGLMGVQFHSDGDAFSSARLGEDAFEAIEEGADADDVL